MSRPLVVWDPGMLGYHHPGGHHPMDPLRWALTWLLAGSLGVIDAFHVFTPGPADAETLGMVHTLGYVDAVRRASRPGFPFSVGHGLGTQDDPIFPRMHASAALIAGGSVAAARAIAHGDVDRAVNFCGGLHHAMANHASGFCVYNDAALAIAAMLRAGVRRVAYVDVDAHHGDGVQTAFYDDPPGADRVHPRDPAGRVPGHRLPDRLRVRRGGRYGGEHRAALGYLRRILAAGLPRGRARGGARVPARDTHHPARHRLPPRGPVGRPEPDRRRSTGVVPGAAGAGRDRHRRSVARGGRRRG